MSGNGEVQVGGVLSGGGVSIPRGAIGGVVLDPQGAVISGATVTITNTDKGVSRTTTTDSAGQWVVADMPSGRVKVEAAMQGFKTTVMNAKHDEAKAGRFDIPLSIGTTNTSVEVTASAPLIETAQAQVTNTYSGTTLATFAGIEENQGLDRLALFVPGVTNTNGSGGFNNNGLRGRNNDQEINGQNNNDSPKKRQRKAQQNNEASANEINLQKKIAGVLPVRTDHPPPST